MMVVDADSFREAMRRLAASVTILATRGGDGARYGMTATAVCSVSGNPPTLLCCINRKNQTRDALASAGRFSVNVLAAGEEELANRFAGKFSHSQRFEEGSWLDQPSGVPVLTSAAAWFVCRTVSMAEAGSHSVFFGEVEAVGIRGNHVMPLLYAHGGYGKFAQAGPSLKDLMWTPDWQVYD